MILSGYMAGQDKSAETIQKMIDAASAMKMYRTDGYSGCLDVIFPEKHICNAHNKNDIFTMKNMNDDLRQLYYRFREFPFSVPDFL